jgi:hypothetical protein
MRAVAVPRTVTSRELEPESESPLLLSPNITVGRATQMTPAIANTAPIMLMKNKNKNKS